jgi:hypothetical protein
MTRAAPWFSKHWRHPALSRRTIFGECRIARNSAVAAPAHGAAACAKVPRDVIACAT